MVEGTATITTLSKISFKSQLTGWIQFFFNGFIDQILAADHPWIREFSSILKEN